MNKPMFIRTYDMANDQEVFAYVCHAKPGDTEPMRLYSLEEAKAVPHLPILGMAFVKPSHAKWDR